jgi:hypothetical protein
VTTLFRYSRHFRDTAPAVLAAAGAADRFQEFVRFKSEQPTQQFGASDRPFAGGSPLGTVRPRLMHAHITQDLSVVYHVSGRDPTVVSIHGIFDHHDLGTGSPANIRRQKASAQQFQSNIDTNRFQ